MIHHSESSIIYLLSIWNVLWLALWGDRLYTSDSDVYDQSEGGGQRSTRYIQPRKD